jgi:hypothetical protein
MIQRGAPMSGQSNELVSFYGHSLELIKCSPVGTKVHENGCGPLGSIS